VRLVSQCYHAGMDTKTSLIEYLGAGLSQTMAAEAAGVSPGYVSQLLSADEEFSAAVRERKSARASRYLAMDELADSTQHTALARLQKVVALETRASVLISAINTLDKMQRRAAPAQQNTEAGAGTVILNLPAVAAHRYTINVDSKNRVIQVDAHTMVPASGPQIDKMVEVVSAEAKEVSYERSTEASLLRGPASSAGSTQAHGNVPAAAGARPGSVGTASGAAEAHGPVDPLAGYDGTTGSLL